MEVLFRDDFFSWRSTSRPRCPTWRAATTSSEHGRGTPSTNPIQNFGAKFKSFFSAKVFRPFVVLTLLFFFQNWDRFYKTPFRPKTFRLIFHSQFHNFWTKFHHITTVCVLLAIILGLRYFKAIYGLYCKLQFYKIVFFS
jgi:hypothetical protein